MSDRLPLLEIDDRGGEQRIRSPTVVPATVGNHSFEVGLHFRSNGDPPENGDARFGTTSYDMANSNAPVTRRVSESRDWETQPELAPSRALNQKLNLDDENLVLDNGYGGG